MDSRSRTGMSRSDRVVIATRDYISRLDAERRRMPSYQGKPFLRGIAEQAGLRFDHLKRNKEARRLLEDAGKRLGYAPYVGTKHQAVRVRIADYAEEKRRTGGLIPADPRQPSRPSHVGVAFEIGVDYGLWSPGISKFTKEQLTGLPLGEPFEPPAGAVGIYRDSHDERLEDFRAFLKQRYEDTGTPVPESLNKAGCPHYAAIQSDYADWSRWSISRNRLNVDTPFRALLLETIGKVGLEPRLKPVVLRVTWEQLLDFAAAARRRETKDTATSEQSVKNLVSAGHQLMRHLGHERADWCDLDLATGLDGNLKALAAGKPNEDTARRLCSEVRALASYRMQLLKELDLPDTFPKAIKELCGRMGVTYAYVEHRLGLPKGTVARWGYDLSMPSPASLIVVGQLEKFFGLSEGALKALLPRLFGRRIRAGEGPSLSERYGSHVVKHLPPDFTQRPREEQAAIIEHVKKTVLNQDRPYSVSLSTLTKDHYALKLADWPVEAQDEWEELKAFKETDLPPVDKERALDAIWNAAGSDVALSRLTRFYGFCVLARDRGGLALPVESVGLGLLACYNVCHAYIEWCRVRRGNKLNKSDSRFLYLVASLVRKTYGPIYQMPSLADRIAPHGSVLKKHFVEAARADWRETCSAAEAKLRTLAKQVDKLSVCTRNPFEPVMGLLECQFPRNEYRKLIVAMRARCPDATTSPSFYHAHVRNCLMMFLTLLLAVRSKNVRSLTYREDHKGHLRQEDGKWVVFIPREEFKNKDSSFFGPHDGKSDFRQELPNKDGLYDLIESYIADSRPVLLNGEVHDTLLVSLGGKAMSRDVFSETFRNVTRKHFAYNPHTGTGMQGVMPHGPHAIRHVVATHVVKNTGRFDWAAHAIQDTEAQVRTTYARFLIGDKHRLIRECLEADGSTKEEVHDRMRPGFGSRARRVSAEDYDRVVEENILRKRLAELSGKNGSTSSAGEGRLSG